MATLSPSSPIASPEPAITRPQADPLPTKRGEIGYRESLNPPVSPNPESQSDVTAHQTSIPARHPADRDPRPASDEPEPPSITNPSGNQSPTESQPSARPLISFFKPKPTRFGVRVSTILLLVTQGSFVLITVALWIILTRLILPYSNAGRQLATSVFIHTTFVVCTLIQVVLLERLIFRYRAERYAMLHHGEALPDLFNRGEQVSTRLALAPWNRPPLPTVSLALQLSAILRSELNSPLSLVRGRIDGIRSGNRRRRR